MRIPCDASTRVNSEGSDAHEGTVPAGGSDAAGPRTAPSGRTRRDCAQSREHRRPDDRDIRGTTFMAYDATYEHLFVIDGKTVMATEGAHRYVDLQNKFANKTRHRFKVCHHYLDSYCQAGGDCPFIHTAMLPTSSEVHCSENFAPQGCRNIRQQVGGVNTRGYPTLPPGAVMVVYPPNNVNVIPQHIPMELIVYTSGAARALRWLQGEGDATVGRPRHCAHFQLRRLCYRASECQFIHSLAPYVRGISNTPADPYAPHLPQVNIRPPEVQATSFGLPPENIL